jgi:hypothetical protein
MTSARCGAWNHPAVGREHGNRRAPIDSCRNLREYLAAYPGLTAVRLLAAAARSGLRAGGYAAVKANRAHRLQPAESGDTLRHTPRPADTSTNTSSAVCASTQYGVGPQFRGSLLRTCLIFRVPRENSLKRIQKFPILLRREFGCKRLNPRVDQTRKSRWMPESCEIPC